MFGLAGTLALPNGKFSNRLLVGSLAEVGGAGSRGEEGGAVGGREFRHGRVGGRGWLQGLVAAERFLVIPTPRFCSVAMRMRFQRFRRRRRRRSPAFAPAVVSWWSLEAADTRAVGDGLIWILPPQRSRRGCGFWRRLAASREQPSGRPRTPGRCPNWQPGRLPYEPLAEVNGSIKTDPWETGQPGLRSREGGLAATAQFSRSAIW